MTIATATHSASLTSGGGPTVFVNDVQRSVDFYTQILGMRLLYQAGPHFAMLDAGGGLQIGLHPPAVNAGAPGTRGSVQVCLLVIQPIEEVVRELQARGVTFSLHGGDAVVVDDPVKLAFFTDLDGNDLYLCELAH